VAASHCGISEVEIPVKPIQNEPKGEPSTAFFSSGTREQVDKRLQALARSVLTKQPESHAGMAGAVLPAEFIDLAIVLSIPVSRLLQYSDSLTILAEMCRLLIRRGDAGYLKLVQGLAHKIFELARARRESAPQFHLFRGIAGIGLGHVEIGVRNVSTGLMEDTTVPIEPADQCLGYWALMSAAVRGRDIPRAIQLAEKWREAAKVGHLEIERFRSRLALRIFDLLLGDRENFSDPARPLSTEAPGEWRQVAEVLDKWTVSTLAGAPATISEFTEPSPLFLGFDWLRSGRMSFRDLALEDFGILCRLRWEWCDPKVAAALTADELVNCANLAAHWELPGFLRQIETVLKERDPDGYIRFSMGRVLGRAAVESLTRPSEGSGPEAVTHDDMILWVMDVRGYTMLAEGWPAEQNFKLLNEGSGGIV